MAASTGKTGRGVTLEITDGASPAVYVAIANVTRVGFTGRSAEQIDFTTLVSDGAFRELRQGFKAPGTIGFDYHFTPTEASHASLLALFTAGTEVDWRINFVGAGWNYYLVGRGFVSNPGDINITINDPIAGGGEMQVSGNTAFVGV